MASANPRSSLRLSICLAIHAGLSVCFAYAYQVRYGLHIDCFDDRGRCFIPGEGVLTSGGAMWGLISLIFAVLATVTLIRLLIAVWRNRTDNL